MVNERVTLLVQRGGSLGGLGFFFQPLRGRGAGVQLCRYLLDQPGRDPHRVCQLAQSLSEVSRGTALPPSSQGPDHVSPAANAATTTAAIMSATPAYRSAAVTCR